MWILQLSLEEIINKVNEKERDCFIFELNPKS